MSLMGMNRAFKKHGALLGGAAALMMLVVAVSGLGANVFHGGAPTASEAAAGSAEQPVATVGSTPVTRGELDQQINSQLQQMGMTTPSAADMDRYRLLILDRHKQQEALKLAAKAAGVTVTDDEITRERDKQWAVQRTGLLTQLGLDAKATDADIDKAIAAQGSPMTVATLKQRGIPDDAVRLSLDQQGLLAQAKKQTKVNEDQVKKSYDEIQVRHILIKTGDGGLPDAAAKAKAEKILAEVLTNPAKMPDLAKQDSDDPGSKPTGGFYDWSPASKYVPEFTAGAVAAGVGKVNPQLIKTSFGYHIIKLEGERPGKDFPKDWDKNKQKYIDDFIAKQADNAVQTEVTAQLPNVKLTVLDPGMLAAQSLQDAEKATDPNTHNAKLNDALTDLNKIKPADNVTTQAPLRRAEILTQLKRPKDAIAEYLQALNDHNSIDTRLTLADLYQSQNDKADALKQVQEANKLTATDPTTQDKIATLLGNLGDADAAKKARDKAADMRKVQAQIEATEKASAAADAAKNAATMPPMKMPAPAASAAAPTTPASPAAPAASPSPVAAAPASPAASPVSPAAVPSAKAK